jgi:hypothetical protein
MSADRNMRKGHKTNPDSIIYLSSGPAVIMILIRGTTAATDDQTPATAKINTFEQRLGLFANRLLSDHHHAEPLTSATKAHRGRFRLMLNQRSHYLWLVYFR